MVFHEHPNSLSNAYPIFGAGFPRRPSKLRPNVVSFSSLLASSELPGRWELALGVIDVMRGEGGVGWVMVGTGHQYLLILSYIYIWIAV